MLKFKINMGSERWVRYRGGLDNFKGMFRQLAEK
jgi:hypothetical protein